MRLFFFFFLLLFFRWLLVAATRGWRREGEKLKAASQLRKGALERAGVWLLQRCWIDLSPQNAGGGPGAQGG